MSDVTTEDEHGEHVYVRGMILDDDRPAWAFYCGHHDEFGQVRLDYTQAVNDGQQHVYPMEVKE